MTIAAAARPALLFLTAVPMTPADHDDRHDDRKATQALVAGLVDLGFDVDIVLQGGEAPVDFITQFGDRVRVASVPGGDRDRDAVLALAAALYRGYRYLAVICNGTATARIAVALDAIRPLPATAVVAEGDGEAGPEAPGAALVVPRGDTACRALEAAFGWQDSRGSRRLWPRPPRLPTDPAAVEAALEAGESAIRREDGLAAVSIGAEILHTAPLEPAGYRLVARGWLACGRASLAADALLRALHAGPADAESLTLAADLARETRHPGLQAFLPWRPAPFRVALGRRRDFLLKPGTAGFGWGYPEDWGCWTVARQARLLVRSPGATGSRGLLTLALHATDDGSGEDQVVDVFVAGRAAGVLRVPCDERSRDFTLPVTPDAVDRDGVLAVDLWIHRPAAKRREGRIVDRRLLGVALSAVALSGLPAPSRG